MRKIILCGPSCTGKTSIKNALVESGMVPGVSYTTRHPRPGELNGVDYRFVPVEHFIRLRDSGYLVEYDDSFGDHYGTSTDDFERGEVFIMTPKTILSLKDSSRLDGFKIVMLGASMKERTQRAVTRGDSVSVMVRRFARDNREFQGFDCYNALIETDGLTVQEIVSRIKDQ